LRKKWGKLRFSEKAVPRPEFEGQKGICKVTGRIVEFDVEKSKKVKQMISGTTILFWAFLAFIAIYYLLMTKTESTNTGYGMLIAFVNAIQIQVFNIIYTSIANNLNHWENHRLSRNFDNSMIVKKIVFQLVNSFASLFFIGFFRPVFLPHTYESTAMSDINKEVLYDLQIQLGTLFVTLIVIQNTQELFMKTVIKRFSRWKRGKRIPPSHTSMVAVIPLSDDELADAFSGLNIVELKTDAEYQMKLPLPTKVMDNMSELIIEEGYATVFAIAFPLASLFACINNFVEFRVDIHDLKVSQRPIPHDASGVGMWGEVLFMLSLVSIVSNWALFVYRTNNLREIFGNDEKILHYFFWIGIFIISLAVWMINRSAAKRDEQDLARIKEIEKFLIFGGRKQNVESSENLHLGEMANRELRIEIERHTDEIPKVISMTPSVIDLAPIADTRSAGYGAGQDSKTGLVTDQDSTPFFYESAPCSAIEI